MKITGTKLTDKFSGFLAVTPNKKFMKLFERADVHNILISYHYIRKNKAYTDEILDMIVERGGLFMTDSGIFSFLNDPSFDEKTFKWNAYVDEYAQWLDQNKKRIFSCLNMDADSFVSFDTINRWNENVFEPLNKEINVVYGCHQNSLGKGPLDEVEFYSKKYDYIGVGEKFARFAGDIYQKSKVNKCKVHGLAWTKPNILRDYPFFSVDSSSWVNYQKYGATIYFDGTNFEQYDNKRKDVRVTMKNKCKEYGVGFDEFVSEKNPDGSHNDDEGLTFSLKTWLDVFEWLKKSARPKLTTTIKDALKDKVTATNIMEDKNKSLADRLGTGITVGESAAQLFEVDEEGNQVAVYEKRNELVRIDEFKQEQGSLMVCSFCSIQEKCPKFKEGATCAFDFSASESDNNPLQTIDKIIAHQQERVARAMFFEKMEGGVPSRVYSQELKILNELNMSKVNLMMLAQNKGFKLTTTTVEVNGADTESSPGGGFASMLQNLLKN